MQAPRQEMQQQQQYGQQQPQIPREQPQQQYGQAPQIQIQTSAPTSTSTDGPPRAVQYNSIIKEKVTIP